MNNLNTLVDYLFEQLDVITNSDLKGDELLEELDRTHAITRVAQSIIQIGAVEVQSMKIMNEYGIGDLTSAPALLKE